MSPVVGRTSTTPSSTLNRWQFHTPFTLISPCVSHSAATRCHYDDKNNALRLSAHISQLRVALRLWLTMLTDVEKQKCTSGRVWHELPALPHWESPPRLCVHTDSLTQISPSDTTHFVTCGRRTKSYKESRLGSINASAPAAVARFLLLYFLALRSEERLEMEPPLLHPGRWKSTPAAGGQRNSSIKAWA